MVKSLDKKWKEFLYAFTGFGPNFLMVLMGAYFTDAINPAALGMTQTHQAIAQGTCFILPAIFPILYALAKAFDGIIDVPFAHITDTLSTKWGRRRPAIAVCMIPMALAYAMLWLPIGGASGQLLNTIWIFFWCLVFFSTYTMCLIAFYGSLSTTCCDEPQRLRVSGYKSFFDTISYCLVYALVPLLLDGLNVNIDKFALFSLPLMATITIPLFLIKEGEKYGYPENDGLKPEKLSIIQSIKLTFGNKLYMRFLLVHSCTFFGLQMFLVGMNAMLIGGMGFNGGQMALANTCAFAPVPIMLYLFNKLKAKKGLRFTYQTCLISFAIAIMSFFIGSNFVVGYNNKALQMIIACVGGVFGSWSIGAFFMMPLLVPAQISSVEEKVTGQNHSAMYFAAQALVTSIIGAISGSLIYEVIKMLFISKDASGVVWAENQLTASELFGVSEASVFNLGTMLVPFIVSIVCILGFIWAFKMPKDYSPHLVAKELKKQNPSLDISAYETPESDNVRQEKGEILFVQIGLSILSGFIFGFIWTAFLLKSLKELIDSKKTALKWILSCFIPFAGIYFTVKAHKALDEKLKPSGKKACGNVVLHIILGILFPLLPINIISLSLLQTSINRLYNQDEMGESQVTQEKVSA